MLTLITSLGKGNHLHGAQQKTCIKMNLASQAIKGDANVNKNISFIINFGHWWNSALCIGSKSNSLHDE